MNTAHTIPLRTPAPDNANMADHSDNIGQNDASFLEGFKNVGKAALQTATHALNPAIETYAQLFSHGARTPVLRRPSDYGMDYEDVTFASLDGVPLSAWYIPAKDSSSKKLLVINHPMPCNRYGFPGHIAPWNTMFGGFEVNFLPELKALHEAGYHIVTYDMRNHGLSGQGNGGIAGIGYFEWQDVIGSLNYVQERFADFELGIYSRCMGANSTIIAMNKMPEAFNKVKAMVLLNAVSGSTFIEKAADMLHLDVEKTVKDFDTRLGELTGSRLADLSPQRYPIQATFPIFFVGIKRDFLIHAEKDGDEIFNSLNAPHKEQFWIEDSNQRFYAYNYFGAHPEKLLAWFNQYMA